MLVPSNASAAGLVPTVTVAVTVLPAGLILDTVPDPKLATQMLVPSNASAIGALPTSTFVLWLGS